ncbi:MAG: carboxypeptidase regulatory-like domain-containing protein [Sandaracinaceae bacterium]|nr:carboxypeptidase regulatory-like domain-containing protein [Sandaracinaceae bacterium]
MVVFFHGGRRFRLRAWHQRRATGTDATWLASSILRAVADDAFFRARAADLLSADLLSAPHDGSLVAALLMEIERGLLFLEEEPWAPVALLPIAPPQGEEPAPAETRELDWIEVEIVDGQGHPMPFVQVEIELPNGQSRRQMTNENGWLRLDAIPAGQCTVRLPRWDRSAWRPA